MAEAIFTDGHGDEFDGDCSPHDTDVLTSNFDQAAEHLPFLLAKTSICDADLLYLYARYKQATDGPCNTRRPGFLEFQAKKKWDAYNEIKELSDTDAKLQYINKVQELDGSWKPRNEEEEGGDSKIEPKAAKSWISVSSMTANSEVIPEDQKTVYDWCRDGNVDVVKRLLERKRSSINADQPDEIGLTMLHWAADRGNIEMVKMLVGAGANVNCTDSEGQTPLHYACSCGHPDIVKELLESRADLKATDSQHETPIQVAEDESIKKLIASWVFWRGSGESISY